MRPLQDFHLVVVLRRLVDKRWSPRTDVTARRRELPSVAIQPPLSMTRRRSTEQVSLDLELRRPAAAGDDALPRPVLTARLTDPSYPRHPWIRSVRAN